MPNRPPAPKRSCKKCGVEFALPKHSLCRSCFPVLKLSIARQNKMHSDHKRLDAERSRSIKAERDRQRANPSNFIHSSREIAAQIQWMESNHLLPGQHRKDFNPIAPPLRPHSQTAHGCHPTPPRSPVQPETRHH